MFLLTLCYGVGAFAHIMKVNKLPHNSLKFFTTWLHSKYVY